MTQATATAPPHNLDAESSLLGSLVRLSMSGEGAKAMDSVCGLTAEDFYREQHRIIFAAVGEMLIAGLPVDLTTLNAAMMQAGTLDKAGGISALIALCESVPIPGNVAHYAREVRRTSAEREIQRIGHQIAAGEDLAGRVDRLAELRAELAAIESGRVSDPHLEIVHGSALENVPQPDWVIDHILRKTVLTLLAGPPRQGKSLAAEAMTIHLAAGREFGIFKIDRPHRVLYFSAEDGPELTGPRLVQLSAGIGLKNIPPPCAFCFRSFKIDDPVGNAAIRKRIKKAQAEVVVFDVLINFHGADENDNGAMAAVMQHFIALARDMDIAILLLHHHRKSTSAGDEGDAIDKSRGASSIGGSCPIIISGRRTCYKVHSKYGGVDDFALKLDEGVVEGQPYMILRAKPAEDSEEARSHQMQAINAVNELSAGGTVQVTVEMVVDKIGAARRTVDQWLRAAVSSGQIEAERGLAGRKYYRVKREI